VTGFAGDVSCSNDGAEGSMGSSNINVGAGCSTATGILDVQIIKVAENTKNCAGFEKMSAKEFSGMRIIRKPLVN